MPDHPPPHEDPAPPAPPPAPPAVEGPEHAEAGPKPADRFRTLVAVAIALVSILGAVVAFTGTLAEQDARQLDQQGIQDASTQQEIITNLTATVQEDQRNLAPYQEDLKAAAVLQQQAQNLQSTDPSTAASLQSEAESYLVLARTRASLFEGGVPQPGPSSGPVQFDAKGVLQRLEANNGRLQELRPDATLSQADSKHGQAVNLEGLVTLFIAALLFLTLAQFARPSIRRLFAAAGGLVTLVAILLWVLVLVTGP